MKATRLKWQDGLEMDPSSVIVEGLKDSLSIPLSAADADGQESVSVIMEGFFFIYSLYW